MNGICVVRNLMQGKIGRIVYYSIVGLENK